MFICNIIKKKLSPSCSRLTWGFMTLDLETCLNETVWFGSFFLEPPLPPASFLAFNPALSPHTHSFMQAHTHTHTHTDTHTERLRKAGILKGWLVRHFGKHAFWLSRLEFNGKIEKNCQLGLAQRLATVRVSRVWMVTLTLVRWCGIKNDQVHLGNGSNTGLWPSKL